MVGYVKCGQCDRWWHDPTYVGVVPALIKSGVVYVADEPELSLHVQWQKYFVSAVKEVMPEECQTIMATHSPEICGAEDVNVQSISVRVT